MKTRRNLILGAVLAATLVVPTVADMLSGRAFTWDRAQVSSAAAQVEAWTASTFGTVCEHVRHLLKK
jgi:hypothetical protein